MARLTNHKCLPSKSQNISQCFSVADLKQKLWNFWCEVEQKEIHSQMGLLNKFVNERFPGSLLQYVESLLHTCLLLHRAHFILHESVLNAIVIEC